MNDNSNDKRENINTADQSNAIHRKNDKKQENEIANYILNRSAGYWGEDQTDQSNLAQANRVDIGEIICQSKARQ
jgi:hypothetical protein